MSQDLTEGIKHIWRELDIVKKNKAVLKKESNRTNKKWKVYSH